MWIRKLLLLVTLFLPLGAMPTQAKSAYIAIGSAKAKKTILAFPPFKVEGKDPADLSEKISKEMTNDLSFMDIFQFLPSGGFLENPQTAGVTPDQFKYSDWSTVGTDFLIKGKIIPQKNSFVLEGYLYDPRNQKQILGKRYVSETKNVTTVAHTFANDIVETLTGLPGVFLTKIAFACDRTGKKEVYVMDFDGSNVKQITNHHSIAFAPAWSPDGSRIAYSLYVKHKRNIKNIDLYEFDFLTNKVRLLSSRKGINSGADYAPDGKSLAMTMSFLGNPEIFRLDLRTKKATRLTHSLGFDVDPSWSHDGKRMAYSSSRTGKPMIFSMNLDGSDNKRLTYAGRYNATPTWSPTNNKMAFAGWLDNRFDIFIMNPDGTNIQRLTKDQGSNEDPHFSPDGNFIVFSSNRTGKRNIYVMNVDGTFVKRLTYGLGNCEAPKWSNPPKSS